MPSVKIILNGEFKSILDGHHRLQKAIDKEEYEMAARIRDKINEIED